MFISIIVPVYNAAPYLPRMAEAFVAQTFTGAFEVILVDDGSRDNSRAICEEYSKKFPQKFKVLHQENTGAPSARNRGLREAQGDYIGFLDADDWLDSNALSVFFDALSDSKKNGASLPVDILEFSHKIVFSDGRVSSPPRKNCPTGVPLSQEEYLKTDFFGPTVWNTICAHDFLLQNNLAFDEQLTGPDDTFFAIQAGYHAKTILVIDYNGYNFFQSADSISRPTDPRRRLRVIESAIEVMSRLLAGYFTPEESAFARRGRKWIAGYNFWWFRSLCALPDIADSRRMLTRLRKIGLFPLPVANEGNCYAFFRLLTRLRFPFLLLRLFARVLPPGRAIWSFLDRFNRFDRPTSADTGA